jgi:hypothetical protein
VNHAFTGLLSRTRVFWILGSLSLSLHALFFAFLHMSDAQRKTRESVSIKDNSAELLQFSRQILPVPREMATNHPGIPQLPDPPLGLKAIQSSHPQARPVPNLSSSPRVRSHRKHPTAMRNLERSRGRMSSPNSGNQQKVKTEDKLASLPVTIGTSSLGKTSPEWSEALARLQSFIALEVMGSQINPDLTPVLVSQPSFGESNVRVPQLQTLDSSVVKAYLALWNQAELQTTLAPLRGKQGMTSPVEVRLASWKEVKASELQVRHGQVLLLRNKILLFWLQADHLYLLQASRVQDTDR